MGQKVMPTGFRLGITEDWRSRWYADKDYAKNLANDLEIRKFLNKQLAKAAVAKIEPFYGAPEPEITTRFTEQEIAVFCGEVQVLSLGYDQLRSIRKIDAVYLLQSSAGQYCYVFASALSAEERRSFLRFLKTKTPGLLGLGGLLREEGA